MVYWLIEGGKIVNNGIYITRLSDKASIAIALKLGDRFWKLRYSKISRKFHFMYIHYTDEMRARHDKFMRVSESGKY